MEITEETKIAVANRIFSERIEPFVVHFFQKHIDKKIPDFHREIFSILESEKPRVVRVAPRGHAKSSIVDLFYTAWEIVNKKKKFILIVSDTYSQAVLFLEALKTEFEMNEKLRSFYGNLVTSKWAEDEIVVGDTMIKAIGAGMKVRGLKWRESRPDLVILDDIENDEMVMSLERREKLERWFNGAVLPSMADDGRVVVIGTILHYDSLLAKMTGTEKYTEWNKKIYRAIENGKALWPEHLNLEQLESLKKQYAEIGLLSQFYQEYMNEPLSIENRKFKQEKTRFYKEEMIVGKDLNTFIAIDRAYSTAKTADDTGIVVVGVDRENKWYVRMAERFHGNEKELIDKLFDLHQFWKPLRIGIEQKAYEFTLKTHMDDEMRKRNDFFVINELKDVGRSKNMRIEGLVPRFESESIFFKSNQTDLLDQMYTFPSGRHDDLIDALAYLLELAEPTYNVVKKPKANAKLTKWG
jgi:phage terminase large subunit-like protein